ncbi:MAG: N-acetyltransferase [Saprospiraceae bacterium]|nr:MAG: N-acetyltransferase [Saprospiraceae bacterium]
MPDNFQLRPATADDVGIILEFIRELAEYEQLLDRVVATEALLRQHLFGERPMAEVVIGYEGTVPVAFALFFHNFSTFLGRPGIYLEDLFVKPNYRRKGYGRRILTWLARLAVERGCGRLEWSVLDWNKPAIDFYLSLGAEPLEEWTTFRLSGEALEVVGNMAVDI